MCSTIELANNGPAVWNPQKAGFWCIIAAKNARTASASGRRWCKLSTYFSQTIADHDMVAWTLRFESSGTASFMFKIHWILCKASRHAWTEGVRASGNASRCLVSGAVCGPSLEQLGFCIHYTMSSRCFKPGNERISDWWPSTTFRTPRKIRM